MQFLNMLILEFANTAMNRPQSSDHAAVVHLKNLEKRKDKSYEMDGRGRYENISAETYHHTQCH